MNSFGFEKPLPSLNIDKDLIQRAESYLRELRPALFDASQIVETSYSITIADEVGTATLNSISEHLPVQLPDSTTQVQLSLRTSADRYREQSTYLDVTLSFGRNKYHSNLRVGATGPNARDLVVAVRDRIESLLEPHRTNARLFYPPPIVSALQVVLGSMCWFAGAATLSVKPPRVWLAGWLIVLGSSVMSYDWLKRWHPWTAFDSRRDRRNADVWKSLRNGFIGFFLTGVVMTVLRHKIFGY